MRVLEELQEDVFRFRVQHRYDHRFLFLVFDLIWSATKIALFVAFTYLLWLAGSKALHWLEVTSATAPVARVTALSERAAAPLPATENIAPKVEIASAEVQLGNQVVGTDIELQTATATIEPPVLAALPEPLQTVAAVDISEPAAEAGTISIADADAPTVQQGRVAEIPALAQPRVNPDATVLDEDWILSQPASQFTIQIGSTPNLLFLRRLGLMLPGDHERAVYHYKTSADGAPEYGLAWGVFDSVAAAQAELAGLDDYSKRYGPWIRRVQGIQQQVKGR